VNNIIIKMSRAQWEAIGKTAGWKSKADEIASIDAMLAMMKITDLNRGVYSALLKRRDYLIMSGYYGEDKIPDSYAKKPYEISERDESGHKIKPDAPIRNPKSRSPSFGIWAH
jgi:hypothetical protein